MTSSFLTVSAHNGALIRLQVTTNCLQQASYVIGDVAANLKELDQLHPDDVTEMYDRLTKIATLIHAALEISWGSRSEIPEELVGTSPLLNKRTHKLSENVLAETTRE